jgi:adenine specific DNA methylase Mod
VLPSLLPEFAGKVNLIYIDPPFNVGSDFSFTAKIADHPEDDHGEGVEFVKEPSIIEQKAYRDTWGKGLDSYMQWFYETVTLLRELLADNGSIYIQLDWHVGHYAKTIMDEVFGYENFRNEIIWKRRLRPMNQLKQYGTLTESIYWYTKSDEYQFNMQYTRVGTEDYVKERFRYNDPDGRIFSLTPLTSPNPRPTMKYNFMGYSPPNFGWSVQKDVMQRLFEENRLWMPEDKAKRIMRKQYLDEWKGYILQNLWDDIPPINPMAKERLDYDTQKPEALLERIIKASSNQGDLVLDCFCGSGTTAAVAEKLHRRWITCDLGRFAIHTARKRFLGIPNVKPFIVQDLGKYERQQWVMAECLNHDVKGLKDYHDLENPANPEIVRIRVQTFRRKRLTAILFSNSITPNPLMATPGCTAPKPVR